MGYWIGDKWFYTKADIVLVLEYGKGDRDIKIDVDIALKALKLNRNSRDINHDLILERLNGGK
jgi:hypothetical protein